MTQSKLGSEVGGGVVRASTGIGLALVVLATLFWSTSGLFINLIVDGSGISAIALAFWRDLTTFLCLLGGLAAIKPGLLRVHRADLPWLAAMGGIGIGTFHVLWNTTVLINGVGISTVLQCNSPVFVTVFAWLLWREPLTWRKWAAIALAGIGTILIARPGALTGAQLTALGLSTALAASLAYSGITLFTKKLTGSYEPWTILVYAFGFAALALAPFQIGRPLPGSISSVAVGAFLALVLITTIMGYLTYTTGLRRIQASVASIVATSEVPFASLLGYVFLAERMDGWQILGAGLVVSGVILLSLNGWRPRLKVR